MTTSELINLTLAEAAALLKEQNVSAVELANAHLQRIERLEPALKCHITLTPEIALAQAEAADRAIAAGTAGSLAGIPASIKDVLCTVDSDTTAGSRILEGYRSPYDATVVGKLRDAGAVFVGKGNTDEFAMGSSTENSAFFPTHNPWDIERVPGGSSGGPAAAVAAGEAIFGIGSDTGGSIRQPASFCGIVGLKPTYGRVSRFGLIAFASSLDQIGPFTRTVEDAALVLEAISGHDPKDSTSAPQPVPSFHESLRTDLRGVRIGVPAEYFVDGMETGVEQAVSTAIEELRLLGAEIRPISLPHTKYALATYYITAPAEASANLARFDGVRFGLRKDEPTIREMYERTRGEGFGSEVKLRIMLGTYALSAGYYDAYYVKAQKVRTLIKRDFDEAFSSVDVVVAPTSPTTAFHIGDRIDDPYQMYLTDVFTIPANMAGIPGISVPCGFSNDLPVGLQFLGQAFDEATVLGVAHAYERSQSWWKMRPELSKVS